MRIRLRRPRYQRNVRTLLGFAIVIPAAGIVEVSGPNPVSWVAAAVLALLAAASVYDAYRWVAVVTRHGLGIAGAFGTKTVWLAWLEIVTVEVDGVVISLTTRDRQIYQVQLDQRAAVFLGSMVERHVVGRSRI